MINVKSGSEQPEEEKPYMMYFSVRDIDKAGEILVR